MNPSNAIKLLEKVDATILTSDDCQNFNPRHAHTIDIICSDCFLDNYCTESTRYKRSEIIADLKRIIRKEKLKTLLL